MARSNNPSLNRINSILSGEDKKYSDFASKVGRGGTFGNEEVKRAIAAGYTMDDVNGYLKYSGITPQGDFAVSGFNKGENEIQNSPNVGGKRTVSTNDPYYRFIGAAPAAPAPAPTPTPAPEPTAPAVSTAPVTPVNPELMIPSGVQEMNVGDSIRLLGENMGVKARRSTAQQSRLTSRGTGRLTIPRSSGYQSLNIGS
jgi:hypothetical protein